MEILDRRVKQDPKENEEKEEIKELLVQPGSLDVCINIFNKIVVASSLYESHLYSLLNTVKGKQGRQGKDGPQGLQGAIGPAGEKGNRGSPGRNGPPGLQGAPGLIGQPGLEGAPGLSGKIYFCISR